MKNTCSLTWGIMLLVGLVLLSSLSATAIDIGPITRTVRSDWINVKTDGGGVKFAAPNAVGNGTADDTASINSALGALTSGSYAAVYFPAGTYKITSTLTVNNTRDQAIYGCGSNTIISWAGPTGGAMFNPQDVHGMLYNGFVWEGNGIAGCAYEQFSPDGNYDGHIRHENESFRDFNAPGGGTYLSIYNKNGNPHPTVPTAAIASQFIRDGVAGSIQADSMVYNCRFSNCTNGFFMYNMDFGQIAMWHIDGCEFDSCGTGIDFATSGCNTVTNCHFQGSTQQDIQGDFSIHIRHCTSQGSARFYHEWNDSYSLDVIQDCWVDGWTSTPYAIGFGSLGGEMVFDCTFTNPPTGAVAPVANYQGWGPVQDIFFSNNYAPGFPNSFGILSPSSNATYAQFLPPGTRAGAVTSATQTFLNSAAISDGPAIYDAIAYGANPHDTGDSTSAIQATINAAKAANNGSIAYIPVGNYHITSALNVSGSNYTIQGGGSGSCLIWMTTGGGTLVSVATPQNIAIQRLRLSGLDNLFNGLSETATGASTLALDDIFYSMGNTSDPHFPGDNSNGPGVVLSSLPAGSKVYLGHILSPLTVQNCGTAQIYCRYLQGGEVKVSGTGAKTGLLGIEMSEILQQISTSDYNINVGDNQDFVLADAYSEQSAGGDVSLQRGGGTGTGRVTIQSFNIESTNASNDVYVNNYAGRLFEGPQSYNNKAGTAPAQFVQSGANPIDLILNDSEFGESSSTPPTITAGPSANLISLLNIENINNVPTYMANEPSTPTISNFMSMSGALDHLRQLEAVDMSLQFGINVDGPPVVSYAFENDFTDQTGTYNATSHGATFGEGEVGAKAACFDGATQYIDMNNPAALPSGTSARSICGWGKTNTLATGTRWIASYGSPTTHQAMFIGMNGTTLDGGGYNDDLTVANFWDSNWHFIVLTYDGTTAKLYADGVLKTSGAKSWNLVKSSAYIGKQVNGSEYWNGSADQVQVYNYALSASEIGNLYNRARVFTPLAAYWKLDESSGTISADSSGNGVTGTWTNSPVFTTDHPSILSSDAGSLSFNGTNQYVTLNNLHGLPFGQAPRTLSAWAKSTTSSGNHFIASYGAASTDNCMLIGMESGTLYGGAYNNDMTVAGAFNDTNWHLVTLTYDGTTESLYFDGVLKVSQNRTLNLIPSNGYIGQLVSGGGGTAPWAGNIDDVRIYNRCLTPAEVQGLAGTNDLASGFNTIADSALNTWSYGTYTSATNPATFSVPSTLSFGSGGGITSWAFPPTAGGSDPNIEYNSSSSPIFNAPAQIEWRPGTVSVGPYQGPAVARFKVPATGHYTINASFQTDQIRGVTSDGTTGSVYVGTTSAFSQALVDPGAAQFGTVASYSATNVALTVGQTVDFVVGGGAFTTQIGAAVTQTGP